MTLRDFGKRTFVTWTEADLRKERIEMDKEYICLSCEKTWPEYAIWICPDCGRKSCQYCGGEVSTIEEYDKAIGINEDRGKGPWFLDSKHIELIEEEQ